MAELKQDVIAGIGDKPTNANVIYPYFDAVVRQFIVGKDCILDGLYLGADGLSLSSGHCLCKGFVGELKDLIRFGINNDPAPTKIYGRFVINHSETDLDYFYIETDPAESAIRQDDILHVAGEYWLLLYENLESKVDRNYPENAVYSDTAEHLVDNGTIAADVEIEGDIPTTPLMYDKRVASTGFVNEAVKELIGYKMIKVPIYSNQYAATDNDTQYKIGELTLERKADYVICTSPDNIISESAGIVAEGYIGNLTDPEFFPVTKGYVLIANKNKGGTTGAYQALNIILVNSDGTVKNLTTGSYFNPSISDDFELFRITGWKVNR